MFSLAWSNIIHHIQSNTRPSCRFTYIFAKVEVGFLSVCGSSLSLSPSHLIMLFFYCFFVFRFLFFVIISRFIDCWEALPLLHIMKWKNITWMYVRKVGSCTAPGSTYTRIKMPLKINGAHISWNVAVVRITTLEIGFTSLWLAWSAYYFFFNCFYHSFFFFFFFFFPLNFLLFEWFGRFRFTCALPSVWCFVSF